MVRHVFYPERQKVNTGQIDFPPQRCLTGSAAGDFAFGEAKKTVGERFDA